MKTAYIDTSCLLAITFEEPGQQKVVVALTDYDELFSSNLLEAELLAATQREGVVLPRVEALKRLIWVWPDRPLTPEFERILSRGYLRGADLWHLASALYLRDKIGFTDFLTLDKKQAQLAQRLDFEGLGWL